MRTASEVAQVHGFGFSAVDGLKSTDRRSCLHFFLNAEGVFFSTHVDIIEVLALVGSLAVGTRSLLAIRCNLLHHGVLRADFTFAWSRHIRNCYHCFLIHLLFLVKLLSELITSLAALGMRCLIAQKCTLFWYGATCKRYAVRVVCLDGLTYRFLEQLVRLLLL